jgi:hypothetical protein
MLLQWSVSWIIRSMKYIQVIVYQDFVTDDAGNDDEVGASDYIRARFSPARKAKWIPKGDTDDGANS